MPARRPMHRSGMAFPHRPETGRLGRFGFPGEARALVAQAVTRRTCFVGGWPRDPALQTGTPVRGQADGDRSSRSGGKSYDPWDFENAWRAAKAVQTWTVREPLVVSQPLGRSKGRRLSSASGWRPTVGRRAVRKPTSPRIVSARSARRSPNSPARARTPRASPVKTRPWRCWPPPTPRPGCVPIWPNGLRRLGATDRCGAVGGARRTASHPRRFLR
jgi:hypothetical protein